MGYKNKETLRIKTYFENFLKTCPQTKPRDERDYGQLSQKSHRAALALAYSQKITLLKEKISSLKLRLEGPTNTQKTARNSPVSLEVNNLSIQEDSHAALSSRYSGLRLQHKEAQEDLQKGQEAIVNTAFNIERLEALRTLNALEKVRIAEERKRLQLLKTAVHKSRFKLAMQVFRYSSMTSLFSLGPNFKGSFRILDEFVIVTTDRMPEDFEAKYESMATDLKQESDQAYAYIASTCILA